MFYRRFRPHLNERRTLRIAMNVVFLPPGTSGGALGCALIAMAVGVPRRTTAPVAE